MLRERRARFKSNRSGREAGTRREPDRSPKSNSPPCRKNRDKGGVPSRLNPHRSLYQIRLFFACTLSLDVILSPGALQAKRRISRAVSRLYPVPREIPPATELRRAFAMTIRILLYFARAV